jgi:hypothetical protein
LVSVSVVTGHSCHLVSSHFCTASVRVSVFSVFSVAHESWSVVSDPLSLVAWASSQSFEILRRAEVEQSEHLADLFPIISDFVQVVHQLPLGEITPLRIAGRALSGDLRTR